MRRGKPLKKQRPLNGGVRKRPLGPRHLPSPTQGPPRTRRSACKPRQASSPAAAKPTRPIINPPAQAAKKQTHLGPGRAKTGLASRHRGAPNAWRPCRNAQKTAQAHKPMRPRSRGGTSKKRADIEQGAAKTAVFVPPFLRGPQPWTGQPRPLGPWRPLFQTTQKSSRASASEAHSIFIATFEQGPAKTAVFMHQLWRPLPTPLLCCTPHAIHGIRHAVRFTPHAHKGART